MAAPIVVPDLTHGHLQITAWDDPDLETVGHEPRSAYVELFWLSVLGPSAVWLLRHLARQLDEAPPEGTWLEVEQTARAIGLASARHTTTVFGRTVERLIRFNAARTVNGHTLAVRTRLPPITRRQADRLPDVLRAEFERWPTDGTTTTDPARSVVSRPPVPTAS